MAIYDTIGTTYASARRPDPRIAAQINAALGDARTVINVGAGAGSYEPPQTVLAVEPSSVMIAQRPAGAAPVLQASAESIPVEDGAADAAAFDDTRAVAVPRLAALLNAARIEPVLVPHDCTDGFGAAYWRRPEAYLDPAVRASISMLAQTGDEVLRAGLDRLADDLASGRWHSRHADLLRLEEARRRLPAAHRRTVATAGAKY